MLLHLLVYSYSWGIVAIKMLDHGFIHHWEHWWLGNARSGKKSNRRGLLYLALKFQSWIQWGFQIDLLICVKYYTSRCEPMNFGSYRGVEQKFNNIFIYCCFFIQKRKVLDDGLITDVGAMFHSLINIRVLAVHIDAMIHFCQITSKKNEAIFFPGAPLSILTRTYYYTSDTFLIRDVNPQKDYLDFNTEKDGAFVAYSLPILHNNLVGILKKTGVRDLKHPKVATFNSLGKLQDLLLGKSSHFNKIPYFSECDNSKVQLLTTITVHKKLIKSIFHIQHQILYFTQVEFCTYHENSVTQTHLLVFFLIYVPRNVGQTYGPIELCSLRSIQNGLPQADEVLAILPLERKGDPCSRKELPERSAGFWFPAFINYAPQLEHSFNRKSPSTILWQQVLHHKNTTNAKLLETSSNSSSSTRLNISFAVKDHPEEMRIYLGFWVLCYFRNMYMIGSNYCRFCQWGNSQGSWNNQVTVPHYPRPACNNSTNKRGNKREWIERRNRRLRGMRGIDELIYWTKVLTSAEETQLSCMSTVYTTELFLWLGMCFFVICCGHHIVCNFKTMKPVFQTQADEISESVQYFMSCILLKLRLDGLDNGSQGENKKVVVSFLERLSRKRASRTNRKNIMNKSLPDKTMRQFLETRMNRI
ncbi:putative signal peptide protein [Puccinia sorghi]|uniref:Putative signal peptide protein n=1 Tax=Puccinia sorghi TaxID=27349 RepID=A0A0L6USK1_9BASI|nr:putative signal peptide protein [Puccinia sorghi]